MDRSSGIAVFGMGHIPLPGIPGRSSVLQSMLQFATKSDEETKERRNITKTHKGDARALEGNGDREGPKRVGEAEGTRERSPRRACTFGQRANEQNEEVRISKNQVGWSRALWPKHIWSKNLRRECRKKGSKSGAFHPRGRNKSGKPRKQRRNTATDGGVGEPSTQKKRSLEEVLEQARNRSWRTQAKEKFLRKFFAASTWASKNSKRKRLKEIAESIGTPLVPVTVELLLDVASVLDETGMQAADQYMAELKWMHIEDDYKWDELLERKLAQCKRALKRDSGPEKRAREVVVELLEENVWSGLNGSEKGPKRPAWAYAWAVIWMLRSIEAAVVKVEHVVMDWKEKKVQLLIPKSKMDQVGRGARRTLACCGKGNCERTCAWRLATQALSEAGTDGKGPLFPARNGGSYSRLHLVASWQKEIDGQMTGHSGRRSGAMMYARKGMQLFDVAFLGRWKSSAVMRYIEEAMEQLAINKRVGSQEGPKCLQDVSEAQLHEPEKRELPAPVTPASGGHEVKIVEIQERERVREKQIPAEPKEDKRLWAISRSRSGRVRHWVMQASWGIPLDEWATACGWHFAKTNVKVELTKFKVSGPKECMKCASILKGRDWVKGGWELAQRVVI